MSHQIKVPPGLSEFRGVAATVVGAVADNYMFKPYTSDVQASIYADVVGALHILWKGTEYKVLPSFNSFNIEFAFTISVDKDDPIFFNVVYSWDNDDF